jgi:hypothetical protein
MGAIRPLRMIVCLAASCELGFVACSTPAPAPVSITDDTSATCDAAFGERAEIPPACRWTATLDHCRDELHIYDSIDCGAEYRSMLACFTHAEQNCTPSPACQAEDQARSDCAQRWQLQTGCSIVWRDDRCPSSQPFLFVCQSSPPMAGCVTMDAGMRDYCCP